MSLSILFSKGSEKVYFALLLTSLMYISLLTNPRAMMLRKHHTSKNETGAEIPGGDQIAGTPDSPLAAIRPADGDAAEAVVKPQEIEDREVWYPPDVTGLDGARMDLVEPYIAAIMDPKSKNFNRLRCPRPFKDRYEKLRQRRNMASRPRGPSLKQYFFAINLHECAHVLPRLLASVVEAMRFLRSEDCVLSIVSGRSLDGTIEVLAKLRQQVEALNATYYFSTSEIDPLQAGHDRITELARLRNLALDPLVHQRHLYDPSASVIFLNDVSVCTDDILELIYQRTHQNADMVCGMDWNENGEAFYDSWVSRSLHGDLFVEIPQSATFEFNKNLFWNDPASRSRFDEKLPLQVYACWNGGAVFSAKPLMQHNISFRASYKDECYMGEPTLLCKDFWLHGYNRIAIVPSVNVGYNDEQSRLAKLKHGYASGNILFTEQEKGWTTEIDWKREPPELVKCQPDWTTSSWEPWDQARNEQVPFDWTYSGYFNAKKPSDHELEFEDAEDGIFEYLYCLEVSVG